MKYSSRILSFLPVILLFLIVSLTPLVLNAEPLIPCDGGPSNECDFNDLMTLINNFINFLIFTLALPLAAIVFAWAGFLFMTSGGDSGKRTKAKGMLINVVIGLVIALAAWLIVQTILQSLGYDGPLFLSSS